MRIVGHKNLGLNQPPATPEEAWQRGRVLDAMLPNLLPVPRGVSRMKHAQRNAQDDRQQAKENVSWINSSQIHLCRTLTLRTARILSEQRVTS